MRILLAVNGSDQSHQAVRSLQYMARAEELHIVHVLDVPTRPYPTMYPEQVQDQYERAERNMREDGTRVLDQIASLLPKDAGPVTRHLIAGSPADIIVALAEQHKVDLTILGTRGLGPIKERLIGSVAHAVLTFASSAKLILPCPLKGLKQILLPLQGTYDAKLALCFLQQKPFREAATITLFTILPQPEIALAGGWTEAERREQSNLRDAENFLNETAAKLGQIGYHTRVAAALGTPVDGILQKAKALDADLILMGSRGRQGVTRMVLGSVSHALLHQGTYPLMIFS